MGFVFRYSPVFPGMTRRPYDMFDTLKAVRPSLRSHMPYGRLCFPALAACSTHSRHRYADFAAQPLTSPTKSPLGSSLHGSAAKPTVSRIIRKPLLPYTRGMFDILKAPLHSLRGSAAKPTVSHVIWKPPVPLLVRICAAKYEWHMEPATPRNHPAWRNTDDVYKQQRARAIGVAQCAGRTEIATQGTWSA